MADATVPLSRSYAAAGGKVSSLTFRQPKWDDFVALGAIEEWQPAGDLDPSTGRGRAILIHHHDVVAQYAERCLTAPDESGVLALLDLTDVLAVHEAIEDFFTKARASRTRPTGSSGSTENPSPTSAG